jgi:wyosine [tRNA(Phe)-imidazoG37] synthetase (radical SAM superfamily)
MIAQLQDELVRGPVDDPRLGKTLIVRPTIETSRANRYPTQAMVVTTLARRMIELSKAGERVQAILVEGEGRDPTQHPEFHEICENLRELVKKWFPKATLCLNADFPDLARPQVRHALTFFDQPVLRLEAGTQKTYAALTGEKPATFKDVVANMGRLDIDKLIVRACFVRGEVDNSRDAEVRAWIRHIADIRPAGIRITTPARAKGKKERPITKTRMSEIAELVTQKTGIPVEVIGE